MKKGILLIISIFWLQVAFGSAGVSGPSTGTVGQTGTYTFNNGVVYGTFDWSLTHGYGTVISSTRSGSLYTAVIKWTASGSEVVNFNSSGTNLGFKGVTVTCPGTVPTPTAGFIYPGGTSGCTSVVINYSFDDNTGGLTWYWQTSSTGTSTSNSSLTFTATSSQQYFLRAYCGGVWSSAQGTSSVTIKPVPSVGAADQTFCSGTTSSIVLTNSNPSTVDTWTVSGSYGSSNGNGTSSGSSPYNYTLSQTLSNMSGSQVPVTYTVTPSLNGCSGSSIQVTAHVNPMPNSFSVSGGGTICSGQSTSITLSSSESGFFYYLSPGGTQVTGNGHWISWTGLTAGGTYTVTAASMPGDCEVAMSGSAVITVNPLPTAYTVSGGGGYCSGQSGPTVSLTGSQSGVNYQLLINGSNSGSPVAGTNGSLSWTNQTTGGNYTVIATNATTGCTANMTSSVNVTQNSLPTQYSVGGGGTICSGSSTSVTLGYSENGTYYQLQLNGSNTGSPVPGGSPITWSSLTTSGSYTVVATNGSTGCIQTMTGSATITVNTLPTVYTISGGGAFCSGQAGPTVSLGGSQSGINYQLKIGGTNSGSPVGGTGAALNWSNQTAGGSYTVVATNASTSCFITMSSSVTVTVNTPPTAFPVSGGGSYCAGQAGPTVSLASSTGGVNYQLQIGGVNSGSVIAGTGSNIYWTNQTAAGSYTVVATNASTGCTTNMSNSATVSIYTVPTAAASNQNIFSSQSTSVAITNPNNVSGTTFAWTVTPTNISGTSIGSGSSIAQTLTNTTGGNGTATYVVTPSANGCSGSSISVLVTAFPFPTIASPQSYVAKNASVALDAGTGYDSYAWTNNAGAPTGSNQTYSASIAGTYTVAVTKSGASASKAFVLNSQFSGVNMNYLITNSVMTPNITDPATLDNLSVDLVNQAIGYFDGLGRPLQNVSTQGSPQRNDLITPFVYDPFGRENKKYLPVSSENTGRYKNWLLDVNGNYTDSRLNYSNGTGDKIVDDTRAFNETIFETSPLNRPVTNYGPGADWGPSGNNKSVGNQYLINVHNTGTSGTQEKVIAWTLDPATGLPIRATTLTGYIASGGYFVSNQLTIKVTTDENGNSVREYTDKKGQVLLKKVQVVASSTNLNSTTDWALTYYLYDNIGNLVYVFQPELSKKIHAGADTYVVTAADLTNYAFQYTYDYRNRMATKQVPGAGVVYMVYDILDRLVLTQDANQRAGATNAIKYWTFTKYDLLDRPIATGIKDTTTTVQLTQAQMQGAVDTYYSLIATTKPWRQYGEYYVGEAAPNNVHGYTNKSYPQVTTAATLDANRYLTVTYYDDYQFRSYWSGTYTYLNENLSSAGPGFTYSQPATEFLNVIGQVTGAKVKVIDGGLITGTGVWIKAVNFYDNKYRLVQTLSDNYAGGMNRTTNVVDFVGKILDSKTSHYITWINRVGIAASPNKLVKMASGNAWGASGAASQSQIPAGQDGWLQVVVTETTTARMIGLSDVDLDANYTTIDYALYLDAAVVKVYEGGVDRGITPAITTGDVLKIARTGTTVKYYKNGTLIYTSPTASSSLLVADAALASAGCTLDQITMSVTPATLTVNRRYEYDHTGRLLRTWHQLNGQTEYLLVNNEYNELGQLVDKKLHSTVIGAGDAKQSVDYRYNIRGWLTSINNSQLANDGVTNDDVGDLFGFQLGYNTDIGVTNPPLFNGNISAIKWSNNLGLSTVKEKSYTFGYDPMNRILSANYKENSGSWAVPTGSAFSESGYGYDLNGNIMTLVRNDQRGSTTPMDNLTYNYGTGTAISNRLVKMTDAGDATTGFIDGANVTTEYTYDGNGNMNTDLNKGITTTMVYNYLNLPWTITRGTGNTITYNYDATGRKLGQTVVYNTSVKQTDYHGEFQYENDVLQFVSHEEGRVVISSRQQLYVNHGDDVTSVTGQNATVTTVTLNGGQTYLQVSSTGTVARAGIVPIGNLINVLPGERYIIRAKGYRTTNPVFISVSTNATNPVDLGWPGATLASSATTEEWSEQIVTIPWGATQMKAGVTWNTTVANGEMFYINDFEIVKLTAGTPEYQYNLKDHLGNVRMTFTTKTDIQSDTATFETGHQSKDQAAFLRYTDARLVNSTLFDHTHLATSDHYAERLNGSTNEKTGLEKSLSVMPGDVVMMAVYAKYVDPNSANWTPALTTLMGQIAAAQAGVVIDGSNYSTNGNTTFPFTGLAGEGGSSGTGPKAYLNYLVFDRNFVLLNGGYVRMTTLAKEAGTNVAHELLSAQVIITQPGYLYTFLSNEETTPVEVYFDDFRVTQTKSPVLQQDDYYPFGLTFNSYPRENRVSQDYKYNGKELQDELSLNWLDYGARMYMPEIGRFFGLDRFLEKYMALTPYHYAGNNPAKFIDVNGDSIIVLNAPKGASGAGHMAMLIQNKDGKWALWSKNGTNQSSGMSGENNKGDDDGTKTFDKPEDFMKSAFNPIVDQETGKREYEEGYLIPASKKEDEAAETGATCELKKDYVVSGSNCAVTVQSGLKSAGKGDGSPSFWSSAAAFLTGGVPSAILGPAGLVAGGTAATLVNEKTPRLVYERIKSQNQGKVIK